MKKIRKTGGQHYIMVYGYTNVSDPNSMTKDNLIFIDPYEYGGQQYYEGNVGNIKNRCNRFKTSTAGNLV